ncbi:MULTISPECIES: DeoR/GlpR family DNA-binding transcription regulator [unclassified Peribacillus]|uniref:DeoR/GlpR family DNA-binding transcription regulator n=1 Tax=unclassified Peribacillus TaxID=2675266 RepID=UPI001911ED4F|nr:MULTISPECIES: DeoR/GlpR family DNA-binding transcription regulator [unclassified Peribacillus]MBK5443051.1 DeoR/GlpR transcriptional regulator [Peribacillus sp. TH24]MBK5462210.1 DeoR/GlpR transcriptional regulator [Peribacillus sp. TH27]MBK5484452.1 DeoR/GlpR transcriptional regulator [Peribacillus sp. TH16]MBK5500363.1 DeoR/GlpR transcriptional regulator [Peribacillus sp. TH14]WMX54605.1 DeoR/GlpR family DNA-binding transcription regulator [Peribacillus sp. R9-11]
MLPLERQKKIIELLTIKKVMKIAELTEELKVSIETLRRDLNFLTKQGKIEKIYGGVKLVKSQFGESTIDERMFSQLKEKEMIAQKCSEYINDGDCIYIDSGSTTYQIANYIKQKKKLTVITSSIPVVNELINSDIELLIIGGKVRQNEQSIVAFDYLFNFSELNISKAFICASGITIEKGISDYNLDEANTRKKIIELSKEVYVAADSTKFGKDVTIGIASLDKIDYIITDHHLHKDFINTYKETNTNLIIS